MNLSLLSQKGKADDSDKIFYRGLWKNTKSTGRVLVSYKIFLEGHYEK